MKSSLILTMIRTGPHEDVAKLYLMDQTRTEEISQQVAAFLRWHKMKSYFLPDCLLSSRFSYAELRSFLNMFYEEEEREADRIRTKFLLIKRRLQRQLDALERKKGEEIECLAASQEGKSPC